MAAPKTEYTSRRHEHEFEIDASPETVWRAITNASELVNWFALEAEVQPGEGGHITYGWGELTGRCRIEVWQPPNHLRTSWLQHSAPQDELSSQVAVDWFIEGNKGLTRLRLVHSGFGTGQNWDEEFEGTRRGWDFELYSLKHYLEHHIGKAREAFWLQRAVALPAAEVWRRMIGPQGLARWEGSQELSTGNTVRISLASGDQIEGRVLHFLPPTEFALSAVNLNNGLLRMGYENCGTGLVAHIWVSLWDYPKVEVAALKARLEQALSQKFV